MSALKSIDQISKSTAYFSSDGSEDPLIDARNLLERLLEPDSPKNESTELFYRQLNRLIGYNRSLSDKFWIELHDDILYLLDESNAQETMNNSWNRFLKKLNLEKNLKQRELKWHQTFGKRKSFYEFVYEYKTFFQDYLYKCISLHSKIQVQGLVEKIDDLLYNIYKLTDVSLTPERKMTLNEKLKSIEINLDSSNRSLTNLDSNFSIDDRIDEAVNNTLNNFLPSIEQLQFEKSITSEKVMDVLRYNRWIIILGDPGSGKTSLLQWLTYIFAKAAHHGDDKTVLEEDDRLSVRIPILIRIGEFDVWLMQNQTKTLIDYIGEHTWFSELYCNDENKSILKKLIYHGHALILLDGLDEITEVGRRGEIVDHVRKFIDQYVFSFDYLSAFDNRIYNNEMSKYGPFIETQLPSISGGNQIIITSRIVGYQLYPVIGSYIKHYSLLLMNHEEAKIFVSKWILQVENAVLNILLNEKINFDRKTMEILLKRQDSTVNAIFENSSKLLMSNLLLLSLICTSIFQLSDRFHPKSRVEVYNYAVQRALRSCTNQQSNISESVFTSFLIGLASYLHLQSPSGLIDAFDMEQLCCLVLKQQVTSNNRNELREKANRLISLLESNFGIVSQRGLQVFGFLHLSFQEYFVAQSFVRETSIEEIVKRILSFSIHSRFGDSLLLALGWISRKWLNDDYDKFCSLLFSSNKDYIIPFGTLLFFDAFDDIQRLPSKSILFIGMNNLFDHPYNVIRERFLSLYLPKFHTNIIMEWMQSHLKDDDCLFKFCQSIRLEWPVDDAIPKNDQTLVLPSICHQLWSFHNKNSSAEFIIDQVLRKTMKSDDIPDQIFNKNFSSYLLSDKVCISNIHPLILSVIIAICGGIDLNTQEKPIKISFWPKKMHRESSVLSPIIEYFFNNRESHSVKIQTLIQQYEDILQTFLLSDTSVDIVDTFIALICLQSVSQPLIYRKYGEYQALPLAIDRLKRTWFYLKKSFPYGTIRPDISWITYEIKLIMNNFFTQSNQSYKQPMSFLVACISPWQKCEMFKYLPCHDLFIHHNQMIHEFFQYQPLFIHLISEDKVGDMINIYSQNKPIFLLNYLPHSLRQLYQCMIISPIDKTDSLPLVVLLLHFLMRLENVSDNDLSAYLILPILHPLLKEHMLENYALVLFKEKYHFREKNNFSEEYNFREKNNFTGIFYFGEKCYFTEKYHYGWIPTDHQRFLNAIKDHLLIDPLNDQLVDWEIMISIERQRIYETKDIVEQEEKDLRLLAASISLARLFQGRYRSLKHQKIERLNLSIVEGKEVHSAIMNILNPVLQTIALNIILEMKDPLIFDDEQRDELRFEIINHLESLLPCLPLLTATLLFVYYYSMRQMFRTSFLHMANVVIEKFNENAINKESQSQQAAYVALKQLNNSDLSHCLSEFAKQTKNLSDLLQFNSTIFFHYFINTTSFDSSNTILLSLMYLIELGFDADILKMFTNDNYKCQISSLEEFDQLWSRSVKDRYVITVEIATWINNHLEILTKNQVHMTIKRVSKCLQIRKEALPLIEKWLNYRMNKDLIFFAQYAALQLTIEGIDVPDFLDIINETFIHVIELDLLDFIKRILNSRFVKLNTIREVIIGLHKNIHNLQKIDILIDYKETLELILNLQFEQITKNVHQSSTIFTRPFLSMIKVCSKDLQYYLVEHLRQFVNIQNEIEYCIKEKYLSVVIKWIIQSSVGEIKKEDFLQELLDYIFIFLYDRRFPQVQKSIINGISSLFIEHSVWMKYFARQRKSIWQEHAFMEENTIDHLENMIYLWNTYSKDVLLISLLAYGKCLIMLQTMKIYRNVSDKMQNMLATLIDTSSSEIISIRAALCLMLSQNNNVKSLNKWNWFENKFNITSEKKYKILLQQILYEQGFLFKTSLNEFVEHLKTYSSELLDTFVNELHTYLHNKENVNYLCDPMPDYLQIALNFSENNFNTFRNTLQKTFFAEEKFKRELYLYYINKITDCISAIQLYAKFGVITIDLIDMVELIEEDGVSFKWTFLEKMKDVSDERVVTKLFQLLESIDCSNEVDRFNSIVRVFVRLAQNDTISLLEVHQRFSSILQKILLENNNQARYDDICIIKDLLDLSCVKDVVKRDLFSKEERRLFIEKDINKAFRDKVLEFDKNLFSFR